MDTGDWAPLRGAAIFLTGGTGFVGGGLLDALIEANTACDLGASVTVLTRDPGAFEARSPELAKHSSVRLWEGSAESFRFPPGRFPFVIHAATERQFAGTAEAPAGSFDGDVEATRRVLAFAREAGARRLLFTSSGAAYGAQPRELSHMSETYAGAPSTTDAATAYGQAKRVGEWLCATHARQFGFDALLARLFAFVGPRLPLDRNFAIGNFIANALRGEPIRIEGDGTPVRSYLYSADLADWLWTLLARGQGSRLYNVGSPHAVSIADVARAVADAVAPGTTIEIMKAPIEGALPARYVPATARAESELGVRVKTSLEEAVRRTFAWYQARR